MHVAESNVLALVAVAAGALSHAKTARFAKIILPWVTDRPARQLVGPLGRPSDSERLRVGEGGRLLQRKADLRIGGEVDAAALFVPSAVGDDVSRGAIGEICGRGERPIDDLGRDLRPRS